jgi:hypothetical protein
MIGGNDMQPFKAMMSDEEVKIIEGLLKPDFNCLEWGSGYSTLYFPQFVKSWYSAEDNREWYDKVEKDIPSNATCFYCPDKMLYLDFGGPYDFILIDGSHREACLDKAMEIIKQGGIILLHDADRLEYAGWIDKYTNKSLIQGEMVDPYNHKYFLIRGLRQYGI